MRVLVDTNILLRSAQPDHPMSSQAAEAVAHLIREGNAVFFCSQVIAEYWNVATRPVEKNGFGLPVDEVLLDVKNIEDLLTLLPDSPEVYTAWKALVTNHKVQGVKVYDARLVAFMHVYAIEGILTFNATDFERYDGIAPIHPSTVKPQGLP
jgi:predicted nucleic acid-binding protein